MAKIVTSPIPRYPGTVTLAEPLTQAQAMAIERSINLPEDVKPSDLLSDKTATGRIVLTALDTAKAPAVLACVEKWDLQNFTLTPDGGLPFSPRSPSHRLIDWIHGELVLIYFGEGEIPNE